MGRLYATASKRAGLAPGSLVPTKERQGEREKLNIIRYDENACEEMEFQSAVEALEFADGNGVAWIDFDDVSDVEVIGEIGERRDIHPLVLEDVVHLGQRPKFEDHGDYIYIVIRMLSYDDERRELLSEQVSLILDANSVFTFQERRGDVFEPIRERIRGGKGRIRSMGSDYLAYCLLDAVIDHYFVILEKIGDRVESLEERLLTNPDPDVLAEIHRMKREMIYLRKSIWPLREVISRFEKEESPLISSETQIFIRDLYDHAIQVIDTTESLRDVVSGMLDTYLSCLGNRMNEVMKTLTIIATIFIPITFIAGVYGMNFEWMPELKWKWSYPAIWCVMLTVAGVMVWHFKKKQWL